MGAEAGAGNLDEDGAGGCMRGGGADEGGMFTGAGNNVFGASIVGEVRYRGARVGRESGSGAKTLSTKKGSSTEKLNTKK